MPAQSEGRGRLARLGADGRTCGGVPFSRGGIQYLPTNPSSPARLSEPAHALPSFDKSGSLLVPEVSLQARRYSLLAGAGNCRTNHRESGPSSYLHSGPQGHFEARFSAELPGTGKLDRASSEDGVTGRKSAPNPAAAKAARTGRSHSLPTGGSERDSWADLATGFTGQRFQPARSGFGWWPSRRPADPGRARTPSRGGAHWRTACRHGISGPPRSHSPAIGDLARLPAPAPLFATWLRVPEKRPSLPHPREVRRDALRTAAVP
jgi:hypothetical protein